jgi:hypothetical protein
MDLMKLTETFAELVSSAAHGKTTRKEQRHDPDVLGEKFLRMLQGQYNGKRPYKALIPDLPITAPENITAAIQDFTDNSLKLSKAATFNVSGKVRASIKHSLGNTLMGSISLTPAFAEDSKAFKKGIHFVRGKEIIIRWDIDKDAETLHLFFEVEDTKFPELTTPNEDY